jgi:hypothetical protein
MTAFDIIRAAGAEPCRPWPRHILPLPAWQDMTAALADDTATLLGLWADTIQVHALFRSGSDVVAASVAVEAGSYPSLSPARPAAALLERVRPRRPKLARPRPMAARPAAVAAARPAGRGRRATGVRHRG